MLRKQQEYGDDYIRTVVENEQSPTDRSAKEPSWSLAIVTAQSRLWLLEAARNSESHFEAMFHDEDTLESMEASMRHGDAVKMLDRWIQNRKDKIQTLPAEQQEAALTKEYAQARSQIVLSLDHLSTIAAEHAAGQRITSYDPSDDTPVRSITNRAPKHDLESFRKDHQFFLEPEQVKLLDAWIEKAPQKSPSDFEREPIALTLSGGRLLDLHPGSSPDVLAAAELCYGQLLDCSALDKLKRWITYGYEFPGMDHDYRITLFHDGLAKPHNFTQLDLRDYEIDYVEFVVRHLGESDTEVFGSHRQRLDQYYDYLIKKQEIEVKRTPQSIQVPLNSKGRILPLSPDNDKGVLAAALDLYSGNLCVSSKEVLQSWVEKSNQSIDLNKVRVYDKMCPLDFVEFSKFEIEKLEEKLSSDRHYVNQADRAKVQGWIALDFRVSSHEPDAPAAKSLLLSRPNLQLVLHHKSGSQRLVSELQVQAAPEKFQDILGDPDWATAKSNREQIDRWILFAKNNREDRIMDQIDSKPIYTAAETLLNVLRRSREAGERKINQETPENPAAPNELCEPPKRTDEDLRKLSEAEAQGSTQPDHAKRIRVFHEGFDKPEASTELDLHNYSLDYVESLLAYLASDKREILPAHMKRLEAHRDSLASQQPSKYLRNSIQVPIGFTGRSVTVNKDSDKVVLEYVSTSYSDNLIDSAREQIWRWHSQAPETNIDPKKVVVFNLDDLHDYKILDLRQDIETLEKVLTDKQLRMFPWQSSKVKDLLESLEPSLPLDPKERPSLFIDAEGNKIAVTLTDTANDPKKILKLLDDRDWSTTARNRLVVKSWLHELGQNPERQLITNNSSYSTETSLSELKSLQDQFRSHGSDLNSPAMEKLQYWIESKECYGEDYFKSKPQELPMPVPQHRYDKMQDLLKDCLEELRSRSDYNPAISSRRLPLEPLQKPCLPPKTHQKSEDKPYFPEL